MKLSLPLKGTLSLLLSLFIHTTILAQGNYQMEHLTSKVSEFKELLQTSKQNHDLDGLIQAQSKLGDFYDRLGIANEAIKHYHEALVSQKMEDTTTIYLNNQLASVYISLKKYGTAQDYLTRGLKLSEKLSFNKGKAVALARLGTVAEKQKSYDQALDYQNQSFLLFETLKDSTGMAICLENIGSVYEDLESYDMAFQYFQRAEQLAQHSPNNVLINIINNLGDSKRKKGELEEALFYTKKALDLSQKTKNIHQEESALKDMARTYSKMERFDLALNYMNKHAEVFENEIERKNAQQVNTLQVLYNVKDNEAKLALLSKENELNNIRQTVLLLISLFVLAVLLGWFLYYKKRQQQESNIINYKQKLLQAELERKTAEEASLQREVDFKLSALTNYSLHLAHKNKMLNDVSKTLTNLKDRNQAMIKPKLEELIKEIDFDLSKDKEWDEFTGYFEQIHPHFFQRLNTIANPELSPTELRLGMLLRLNLSSKEIASILRITPDSVRIARYRMRKKLPLDSKEDIQSFLVNL